MDFEGIDRNWNAFGSGPPDPNGDIGPSHYVQTVNTAFAVWDRTGILQFGPADLRALFQGFGGLCEEVHPFDPVVLYDHLADRWLISYLAHGPPGAGPHYQCLAVSQTPDPTVGSWHLYEFLWDDCDYQDYSKFGVWSDAYYMGTINFSDCGSQGLSVVAFERAAMLNGNPAQVVRIDRFDLGTQSILLPADLDGAPPASGTPNYFARLDFDASALQVWAFSVDWANPGTASFTQAASLPVGPIDRYVCANQVDDCIDQPGTTQKLDQMTKRLMYRLQYRNFGSHQALLTNHALDVDEAVGQPGRAGIRWYELRDYGSGWGIHQQGTYAPDTDHRWMGSVAMNGDGDIALGYTASSASTYPSIRIAGQTAGAPAGLLNAAEQTLQAGGGSQTGSHRWGDYSMMAVDPVDDRTFWFTHEYFPQDSPNFWHTRIGAFHTAPATVAVDGLTLTDRSYYEARDALTAGSTLVIASGADVTLRVTEGGFIEFLPGFEAAFGSALHAHVEAGSGASRAAPVVAAAPSADGEYTASAAGVGLTAFHLAQNYPNPFGLATEIAFDLPTRSEVLLTVYDVLGREVARLAEGPMEAGAHRVRFDASGVPSGPYLYRLQAGDVSQSRRMTVLR